MIFDGMFCLTVTKKIVEETFVFHLISRTKKNSRGTSLCFKTFLVSKLLMDKRGRGSFAIFSQKCFVSQCRKKSYRNPSVFR